MSWFIVTEPLQGVLLMRLVEQVEQVERVEQVEST